jgi:putative tricarboxylic transport membrane protein
VLARAVPLVLLAAAGVYLTLALQLPFGAAARPGAGFSPVFVAVFAIVVALAATASAFRSARSTTAVDLDAASRRRVVLSVVALVAFCLVLPWVGYPAAAGAFVTVVLRCLGSRWTTALLIGVLSAAGSYGLFAVILDVPLPRGALVS